ncbi:Ribosomal large subunit pseudouridine synthase D [hydrothermal vent metagenome]|uniref:Ribosomal large subunit pseudouridine synthase D n=1 Tax=hydrothermal vent metagenome TaxID=652676 RepID=A0A160TLT7_9ZZZZ
MKFRTPFPHRYGMDRGVTNIEARISDEAGGWRLDRALADAVPTMSRERLKALIASGAVIDEAGALARDPSRKALAGSIFTVAVPAPTPAHNEAQDIALNIVFEDDHLIVIDKQPGLVVHPAAGNLDGTLVNALLHHCAGRLSGIGGVARPGIVHRIDKDTSGLMVAAKTDRAHEGLAKQFHDHSIDRRYKAIVTGRPLPAAGTIDAPLARSPANRKKIAIQPHGKRAVTHYTTLERLKEAALVECRLETGRTHQVRVHMASIGNPLIGDPTYGRTKPVHRPILETLDFRRQALHAARLGFIHPVESKPMAFDSEMPADMQELFDRLYG